MKIKFEKRGCFLSEFIYQIGIHKAVDVIFGFTFVPNFDPRTLIDFRISMDQNVSSNKIEVIFSHVTEVEGHFLTV